MNGSMDEIQEFNRPLKRFVAKWDYQPLEGDELRLYRGDILLVADEFDDGWSRGLRLSDLEIGFFPAGFAVEDISPVYKLKDIKLSTDDYINDPKFTDIDSSRRSKIAFEIFTSEEAYLNKMKLLNEKFVLPLHQNTTVISREDYGHLITNILPLLSLSESMVIQLKSRMSAWDEQFTMMGDIFMHMGHHMKLFATYAVQHRLGSQRLAKIVGNKKFKRWLARTEMECQRTLNALLMEPIQRVPRYVLLLKDLLKHTPEHHVDYSTLKEALNFVQMLATDCNENIRTAENEFKLFVITRMFPNDDVDILSAKSIQKRERVKSQNGTLKRNKSSLSVDMKDSMSVRSFFEKEHHRVFIKEGVINKTKTDFTDPSERYLFLCSNVVLIATPTHRSRKTFKLKERVMLVHTWVTDTATFTGGSAVPEKGFIFGTPKRTYHFLASSKEDKNSWFRELQRNILAQKKMFNELLTHLSIPDERFQSVKVKANIDYLGKGMGGVSEEELTFKAGDEVSIVGFQNGIEKWKPGLYSQELFDPSSEWYFGVLNDSYGWFPIQCISRPESKQLDPLPNELKPTPMWVVLDIKQKMVKLTGREIPRLRENEKMAKVYVGEGNFKTLRIPVPCSVDDIVKMFFKMKPDSEQAWDLIEQSLDQTVHNRLNVDEDLSKTIDCWGKSREHMRFLLRPSIITGEFGESYA